MKNTGILLFVMLLGLSLTGCKDLTLDLCCDIKGSGNLKTEKRELHGFDKVTDKVSSDIYISQGTTESFTIETDDNIHDHITTTINNGNLVIDSDGSICPKKLEMHIGMINIAGFTVEGSSDIIGTTPINCPELSLIISGSGNMNFKNVATGKTNITIEGSGDILLTGTGTEATIVVDGSGDVDLQNMELNAASITINGSGDVKVNVKERISVIINGSGDVYYKGTPADVNTDISGSGSLAKIK